MTATSRRAILAGAASLSAAIGTATALAAPSSVDDAELLALGSELDLVIRDWLALRLVNDRDQASFEEEVERRTGIKFEDAPEDYHNSVYWNIRGEVAREGGTPDTMEQWNEIHGRKWPLVDRIMSLRATAVAGLAVQARAASLAWAEVWDDDPDDALRNLIELLCDFTGVAPVPALLEQQDEVA
jgi:hypothetical protein